MSGVPDSKTHPLASSSFVKSEGRPASTDQAHKLEWELEQALRDELRARVDILAARQRQSCALRALKRPSAGWELIAGRCARALGLTPDLTARLRLADRFRKLASRTPCPPFPSPPPALDAATPLPWLPSEELPMANKLVRRVTTTEETYQADDDEKLEGSEGLDDADGEQPDAAQEAPSSDDEPRPSNRRPSRRC